MKINQIIVRGKLQLLQPLESGVNDRLSFKLYANRIVLIRAKENLNRTEWNYVFHISKNLTTLFIKNRLKSILKNALTLKTEIEVLKISCVIKNIQLSKTIVSDFKESIRSLDKKINSKHKFDSIEVAQEGGFASPVSGEVLKDPQSSWNALKVGYNNGIAIKIQPSKNRNHSHITAVLANFSTSASLIFQWMREDENSDREKNFKTTIKKEA